jgi:hypothetical protein
MAYRTSQPLAATQFNEDKPKKKKKKTTTTTKTRTLRGMSVRQADKARSGSIDREKTTTKTTVEKAPKSKSTKEKKTMLDKRIDRTIKRYNKKGINTEGTRAAMERDSFKSKRETRQAKKSQSKRNKKNDSGRLKSFKEISIDIKDACKGKRKGTKKCASTKKRFK